MPVIGSNRRAMTAGRSMVGARRFAKGGKPKKPVNPEEGDLNPFGDKTVETLNEIQNESKKKRKMATGGSAGMESKSMEMRHAKTLSKIAKEEASHAKKMKCGGKISRYATGGYVSAADGCTRSGRTKGRFV